MTAHDAFAAVLFFAAIAFAWYWIRAWTREA